MRRGCGASAAFNVEHNEVIGEVQGIEVRERLESGEGSVRGREVREADGRGHPHHWGTPAEEVAGIICDGVPESFKGEGSQGEVLEDVLLVPIAPLGPLRTTKDNWGWRVHPCWCPNAAQF